jgi:hypothetical protein
VKRFAVVLLATAAVFAADSAAGIRWTAPSAWKNEGSRPMRAATYIVAEDAECVAYYFGPGQGGSVEANILRWKGQFLGADGKVAPARTGLKTIRGFQVATIESAGVYTGMGGPMVASQTRRPGFQLLGAIVEAPEGAVFFKFTGPSKTVEANRAAFDKMIASITKN